MSKQYWTQGELFAGISGFGLGFSRSNIRTLWSVEIDPQCQDILRYHYHHHKPRPKLFADVREVGAHNLAPVDIITFGSPCQDLSVAGRRAGLAGERSNLFYEAIRIITELNPTFAVWENVPGAFSSNAGRDFAAVLTAFRECGARDIAWRILDAQYFGVAQRRKRLFVIADFGAERAAEVLFESARVPGNPAAGRKAGARVAATLTRRFAGGSNQSPPRNEADNLIGESPLNGQGVSPTLHTGMGHRGWSIGDQDWGLLQPFAAGKESDVAATVNTKGDRQIADIDTFLVDAPPVAGTLVSSGRGVRNQGGNMNETDFYVAVDELSDGGRLEPDDREIQYQWDSAVTREMMDELHEDVAATLNSGGNQGGFRTEPGEHLVAHPLVGGGNDKQDESRMTYVTEEVLFTQNQREELREMDVAGALGGQPGVHQQNYVAYSLMTGQTGQNGAGINEELAPTLDQSNAYAVAQQAYNIQTNDGGQHRRSDRPEGGMYVKETDVALTVGSTDQTVVAEEEKLEPLVAHESGKGFWTEGLPGLRAQPGGMPENVVVEDEQFAFEPRFFGSDREGAENHGGAPSPVAPPLKASSNSGDAAPHVLALSSDPTPKASTDIMPTLQSKGADGRGGGRTEAILEPDEFWTNRGQSYEVRVHGDVSPTMSRQWGAGGGNVPNFGVRRLMPVECERLQGFPDDWTLVGRAADGKLIEQSDSVRYRQLGNAVCVSVTEWLGRRLAEALK